jgi:SAM-dependent methyltransferase
MILGCKCLFLVFLRDWLWRRRRRKNIQIALDYYDDTIAKERIYLQQRTEKSWLDLFGVLKCFCSSDGRVLDVGCGGFELIMICNRAETVGVDISKESLRRLKKFGFAGNVVQASCTQLPFKDRAFSSTFSNQVVEHMLCEEDVTETASEMLRVAPRAVIVTPNSAYLRRIYESTHFLFLTTRSLKRLLCGFNIYAAVEPQPTTLKYYLLYDSPRLNKMPLIGKMLYSFLTFIDNSRLMRYFNKRLWVGVHLVAVFGF